MDEIKELSALSRLILLRIKLGVGKCNHITDFTKGALKRARIIRLLQCASNPTLLSEAVDDFVLAGTQYGEPITASQDILDAANKYNTEIPNKYTVTKALILNLTKSSGPEGKVIG